MWLQEGIKERVYLLFYNKIQTECVCYVGKTYVDTYTMVRVLMNFSCNVKWRKRIRFNKNRCSDDGNNKSQQNFLIKLLLSIFARNDFRISCYME